MAANLLVIDDGAIQQSVISAYLSEHGYRLLFANNHEQALQMLSDELAEAIICDLDLPGFDGLELLRSVRLTSDLPVVVISSSEIMENVVQALRLGADDFLAKPITEPEVLAHALAKALQRYRLEEENKAYREYLEKTNTELRRGLDELRADQLAGRHAQQRMLPESISFRGVKCEHRLTPSLLLSGDFLDYFELDDDRLVFYLADVSGHGASSAFVTVLLKNLTYRLKRNFNRGSSDDVIHPARVLHRVNSELHASELDKHLTMFYGVICLKENTLHYSVGGHFPMPIMLTEKGSSYLDGRAMPIGLFPEAEYQEYKMSLEQNFSLLMFSDGILEIMPESTLNDKEEALLAMTIESRGDVNAIAEALGIPARDEVPDDIAMVSVSRGGL